MIIYPLIHKPDFSYNDFLMHNQYIGDIKNGVRSATSDVVRGQALSTKILNDTINKNGDFIVNTIDSSFTGLSQDMSVMSDNISDSISTSMEKVSGNISELGYTIDSGFDSLGNSMDSGFNMLDSSMKNISTDISILNENLVGGLDQVSSDIQNFRSDFNMAIGGVILQFEMQREEMRQGFHSIISILENKRKTDATEDFRDAIDFYNDGCKFGDKPVWFRNAHKHFSSSIDKYERNPLAHLHLAHIYHYQEEFRDFDKALEHYELCYTYGEADDNSNAVTAQGYFYAGWLKASVFDDLDSAIKLTEKALVFDKTFSEAYYNLAKFYSLKNNSVKALEYLEIAIVKFDKNYIIKIESDTDFDNIRDAIHNLFLDLKDKIKENFKDKISFLKITYSYPITEDKLQLDYNSIWQNIDNLKTNSDTYFFYLEALSQLTSYSKKLTYLINNQKSHEKKLLNEQKNIESILSKYNTIKKFISDRTCTDKEYHLKINSILKNTEQLFMLKKYQEGLVSLLSISDKPLKIDFSNSKIIAKKGGKVLFFDNKTTMILDHADVHFFDINSLDNISTIKISYSRNMAISHNKKFITLANFNNEIQIWDNEKNKFLSLSFKHASSIEYLEFSPDDKYLLSSSGHDDKNIRLWNIVENSLKLAIPSEKLNPSPIAFSPCGKYFIVANPNIYLYEIDGYKKELLCERYSYEINILYSPDGKYVAYGRHYDISILNIATKEEYCIPINKDISIQNIAYSPNGKYIAVGDANGTVSICDIEHKKVILSLGGSGYANVQYSPDGKYITTRDGLIGGKVYLWNVDEVVNKNFDVKVILNQLKEYEEQLELKQKKEKSDLEKWKETSNLEFKKLKVYKRKDGRIYVLTKSGLVLQGKKTPTYNYESSLSIIKNLNEFICIYDNENEINKEMIRQKKEGGQCEICGGKLGMMDKIFGHVRCKKHR